MTVFTAQRSRYLWIYKSEVWGSGETLAAAKKAAQELVDLVADDPEPLDPEPVFEAGYPLHISVTGEELEHVEDMLDVWTRTP